MNKRLKEARTALGLSQIEVAKKIGVSRSAISRLESGDISFTGRTIQSICEKLHINETWFRSGEGEMLEAKGETLEDLLGGKELDETERSLFETFLTLPHESRQLVIEFVEFCAAQFAANPADVPSVESGADVAAQVAELERQLAAEKARADRAEAEAREARAETMARTEELLSVYREDMVEDGQQGLSPVQQGKSSSPSR